MRKTWQGRWAATRPSGIEVGNLPSDTSRGGKWAEDKGQKGKRTKVGAKKK